MQTNKERLNVEDKLAELELQHAGLQELISTLQDNRGAQKVAEWHAKMEQVRLNDLRLKREIDRHKAQLKFLESILKKHEMEVVSLEEEKVRLTRVRKQWSSRAQFHS
jgi:centrosomal protein CEP290